jgi:hypothetical protein
MEAAMEAGPPSRYECPTCGLTFQSLRKHYRSQRGAKCFASFNARISAEAQGKSVSTASASSSFATSALELYGHVIMHEVAEDLARLRYEKYMSDSFINVFVGCSKSWHTSMLEEVAAVVNSLPGPNNEEVKALAVEKIKSIFNIFEGLETAAQRKSFQKKTTATIEVIERPLGYLPIKDKAGNVLRTQSASAADVPIIETLTRLLQTNKRARKLIMQASNRWMQGDKHCVQAEHLADMEDGDCCRFHPHLMRKATEQERIRRTIRIGLCLYQDGIEPCNTLGYARGKHKIVCYYYNIVNLPARLRNSLTHLQLFTIVRAAVQKLVKAARVLSGVDADGKVLDSDWSCGGAQMRKLNEGVEIEIPNE